MFIETVFVALLLFLFGLILCFAGFRLFVLLLPLYGFFAGFLVTAQAIQQVFGGGFLATAVSWVFAFVIGAFCALAAYFFYYAAVVVLAASVGYELAVGILSGLGVRSGVLLFVVGLVVALALAVAAVVLNLARVIVVVLTALAGSSMILTGVLLAIGHVALTDLYAGVIGAFIHASWFLGLLYLVIAALGIISQIRLPQTVMLQPYSQDRLTMQGVTPEPLSVTSTTTPAAPSSPAAPPSGAAPAT